MNPLPLAPEARIIPLDHWATSLSISQITIISLNPPTVTGVIIRFAVYVPKRSRPWYYCLDFQCLPPPIKSGWQVHHTSCQLLLPPSKDLAKTPHNRRHVAHGGSFRGNTTCSTLTILLFVISHGKCQIGDGALGYETLSVRNSHWLWLIYRLFTISWLKELLETDYCVA